MEGFAAVPGPSQAAFDALNTNIANCIAFETKQFATSTSVAAGANTSLDMDVTKTGYTPRMVMIVSPWAEGVGIIGSDISGNTVSIGLVNVSSSAKNVRPKFVVMYTKTSSPIV